MTITHCSQGPLLITRYPGIDDGGDLYQTSSWRKHPGDDIAPKPVDDGVIGAHRAPDAWWDVALDASRRRPIRLPTCDWSGSVLFYLAEVLQCLNLLPENRGCGLR
jgi:hypothetical protein